MGRNVTERMLTSPAIVVGAWIVIAVVAGIAASRLPAVLRGGTHPIAGSPSERVERELVRAFGEGVFYQYLLVLSSPHLQAGDPRFSAAARRVTDEAGRLP